MHDDDSPHSRELPSGQEAKTERAVLFEALDEGQASLSLAELVRRITTDPEDPAERDGVQGAVSRLLAAGLLARNGEALAASPAALRANALLGETC